MRTFLNSFIIKRINFFNFFKCFKSLTISSVFVLVFIFSPSLFSQETQQEAGAEDNILKIIEDFNKYIDNQSIVDLNPDYEANLYSAIQGSLVRTKDFVNSVLFTMNETQGELDREATRKNLEFYSPVIIKKNNYDQISSVIDYNFYLIKSLNFLSRMNQIYEENEEGLVLAIGADDLRATIFELKSLLAILYYYKGDYKSVVNSIGIFKEILGHNGSNYFYVSDGDASRTTVYYYLVSAYNLLLKMEHPAVTYLSSIEFVREKLFYSWQVVMADGEREDLKNFRLRKLSLQYYDDMDKNGARFREIYAPFMVENNIIIE